jgi:hypothetical protein
MELFIVLIALSIAAVCWFYRKTTHEEIKDETKIIDQVPYKVEVAESQSQVDTAAPHSNTVYVVEVDTAKTPEVKRAESKPKTPRKKAAKSTAKSGKSNKAKIKT